MENPDSGSTCGVSKTYAFNQDPDPHLAWLGDLQIQNKNNNSSHPGKVRKAIRFIELNVQKRLKTL
jgi:hypothetical protein